MQYTCLTKTLLFLSLIFLAAACHQVAVEPGPAYPVKPYVSYDRVGSTGTSFSASNLGYLRNDLAALRFVHTGAGRLQFEIGNDYIRYMPTERFLLGDSVTIWEGPELRATYLLSPYLTDDEAAWQQSPLHCPTGQTISVDLSKLSYWDYLVPQYSVRLAPRMGQATIDGQNFFTYTAGAASGTDTLSLISEYGHIIGLRVLVGDAIDAVCLDRLTLRNDTIRVSQYSNSQNQVRLYEVKLTELLANDDYCPEYLDLTSFRLIDLDPNPYYTGDSAHAYSFSPQVREFSQVRNLPYFRPYINLSKTRYRYRISNIGGVEGVATITIVP